LFDGLGVSADNGLEIASEIVGQRIEQAGLLWRPRLIAPAFSRVERPTPRSSSTTVSPRIRMRLTKVDRIRPGGLGRMAPLFGFGAFTASGAEEPGAVQHGLLDQHDFGCELRPGRFGCRNRSRP
jgi:hypothetical protein